MATFTAKAHDALDEATATGHFVRTAAGFREIISPNHPIFQPSINKRYHLYISYACPWANRCLAMLYLKNLQDCIGVTVVHPTWQKTRPNNAEDKHCGWAFFDSTNPSTKPFTTATGHGSFAPSSCELDHNSSVHAKFIRDLYEASNDVLGKYSVPVLWDNETSQIVNNESSEIVRMLNDLHPNMFVGLHLQQNATSSNDTTTNWQEHDFYPLHLRSAIDDVNSWIYTQINDGVYKCGFARTQVAYEQAISELYAGLDRVEEILRNQRYLVLDSTTNTDTKKSVFTEADIRLYMTLVRFDEVYVVYFKCNVRTIRSYPAIQDYVRDLYQVPEIQRATNMEHIKMHYFTAHPLLNPYGIIPKGPNVTEDLLRPHQRAALL